MGEVMRLEVAPDDFDVVEFGSVFGQPLDGEPVLPSREGGERELTPRWIDPLSSTSTTGLVGLPGLG